MVYTRSSTEELPTLSVAGRVPSDPPGTLGEEVRLAISTDVPSGGGVYRWGDYFDATIDPEDDGLFWVVGQIYGEGGWVTEISSFVVRVIGDLDEDGVVDGSDLTILLGSWGESDPLPISTGTARWTVPILPSCSATGTDLTTSHQDNTGVHAGRRLRGSRHSIRGRAPQRLGERPPVRAGPVGDRLRGPSGEPFEGVADRRRVPSAAVGSVEALGFER